MNETLKLIADAGVTGPSDVDPDEDILTWQGTSAGGKNWSVFCGDSKNVLESLESESANCIVTSPPYFWLRDYGVDGQLGLEETVEEYVQNLAAVMSEAKRVLADDGLLFLNIGDTYYSGKGMSHGRDKKSTKRRFGLRAVDKSGGLGIGMQRKSLIGIPWRVAMELTKHGWALRTSIIWHRENCLPEHVRDRPSRSYEFVFMFSKSRFYYFDKKPLIEKKIEEDMWSIKAGSNVRTKLDTAPFPDELVERCLEIGCKPEGTVLDPFCGSGTTVRVANAMGYDAIGIDLNEEFCRYSANQMKD